MIPDDPERLRDLLADGEPSGPCPSPELLARVATGDASARERDAVVDHLATCAACSEEYRVAATVADWGREASREFGVPSSVASRARPRTTVGYAAAAALLVAVSVGLLAWALSLREDNARLATRLQQASQAGPAAPPAVTPRESARAIDLQARLDQALAPALNVPIIDLLPSDAVRGSGSRSVPRIPAGARLVTFVITTASNPAATDHQLEIIDSSGAVLWRGEGLRANSDRAFTVTVPRSLLHTGTSRLRLYAGGKLIAEYSVAVDG